MTFDFQEVSMTGGVIVYPDYPFADLPKDQDDIKETVSLIAGTIGTAIGIQGSADSQLDH